MTALLQVALGPVQGFIATARRSRDLWFGSFILSELSKAAARALHNGGAELIFPAPKKPLEELAAGSDFLVANIVTASSSGDDTQAAAERLTAIRKAVEERWEELCKSALKDIEPLRCSRDGSRRVDIVDESVWNAQLSDVVEFFCAAVPWDGQNSTYAAANDRLRTVMAQRKSTRSFQPYRDASRLPKSSLDGARSTALARHDARRNADAAVARRRVGIDPGEELDTPGLVKRIAGRGRGFVPVSRVAADEWLQRLHGLPEGRGQATLEKLKTALDGLEKDGLATPLNGKFAEYGWLSICPFDAQMLYPQRLQVEVTQVRQEMGLQAEGVWRSDRLGMAVAQLGDAYDEAKKLLGAGPQPYYAMLLADGDRMGGLIDHAAGKGNGLAAHRKVSRALAAFAQAVPATMASCRSACIYSGGDDVLGVVPVRQAIGCALALKELFAEHLHPVAKELGLAEPAWPTLSVGLAITHMLEPLGDARALAQEAERLAKADQLKGTGRDRNALALIAQPRSGNAVKCRIPWGDALGLEQLTTWADELQEGALPGGVPHELEQVWLECQRVFPVDNKSSQEQIEKLAALWRSRVRTVLSKKRLDDGALLGEDRLTELLNELAPSQSGDADALRAPLDRLLVARWLSTKWLSAQREESV